VAASGSSASSRGWAVSAMRGEERIDLEREEQVARALGRPVRDQHIRPFPEVEARLRRRASSSPLVVALLGVVVLGLIVGSVLAERRITAQPGPVPTTAASPSPLTWQEGLVADARQLQAQLVFWPLVPTYSPVEAWVRVRTRDGCGISASPCLDYRFESLTGALVLEVLQGPAGCCLDAARPGAVRNIDIRPDVRAQYDPVLPQFGGPILWWVEATARGPVYVALNSPALSGDDLVRIARSMRPLPDPASASSAPTAVASSGSGLGRPRIQATAAIPPVLVTALAQAGTIGISFGGDWSYDGRGGVLSPVIPGPTVTEHPAPQGALVAVERLSPTVPGSPFLIAKELAIRDGGGERVVYRASGDGFYWSGWSPDGRYVALWELDQYSGSVDMDGRPLVIIDVQSGARTDLGKTLLYGTTAWTAPHTLAYVAGVGRFVWDTKTLRLWSPEEGVRDVTAPAIAALGPAWSADGRSLYFVSGPAGQWDPLAAVAGRGVGDRRISVYDAVTGVTHALAHETGYVEEGVRPSRDGSRLLVLRRRTAAAATLQAIPAVDMEIWLTDANGGNGTVLVRFPSYGLNAYGYLAGPSEWTWSE
jgi:WD40 repeat protein